MKIGDDLFQAGEGEGDRVGEVQHVVRVVELQLLQVDRQSFIAPAHRTRLTKLPGVELRPLLGQVLTTP